MPWDKMQMVAATGRPEAPQEEKFTPADASADWPHVNVLVHGPGAPGWEKTGEGDANSAVFACLMAIATAYPEPPLTVYRKRAGREYSISDHPLQKFLDMPTPGGALSLEDIWFWTAWAKHTDGNAYLLKRRAGDATRGNVVEMWPVSPNQMRPVTERDRNGVAQEWISYYRMQVGPNRWERVEVENVIHLRLGVDPQDRRLGISPLKRLLREVATDDEATKFTDALLKNFAVPGLVVVPAGDTIIDKDSADHIAEVIGQKFGNDNRGKIAVLSAESKLQQFGFSPEQLQMNILHQIPEERISAVIGVPAIVAGLGAGLARSTFANFKEAREMFTEQKLVPQWRQDAARMNIALKPDFTSDRNVWMHFDISNVRALQEDQNQRYVRLNLGVQGGWILRNEARADVGFEPIEGWDDEDIAPPMIPAFPTEPAGEETEEDIETASRPGPFCLEQWIIRQAKQQAVRAGAPAYSRNGDGHD